MLGCAQRSRVMAHLVWLEGLLRSQPEWVLAVVWTNAKPAHSPGSDGHTAHLIIEPWRRNSGVCPRVAILLGIFYVMHHLGYVLDTVPKGEYARLHGKMRFYLKGQ